MEELKANTLYINPGEVCAREKPNIECVMLEIKENEYIINVYSKELTQKDFIKVERRYARKR